MDSLRKAVKDRRAKMQLMVLVPADEAGEEKDEKELGLAPKGEEVGDQSDDGAPQAQFESQLKGPPQEGEPEGDAGPSPDQIANEFLAGNKSYPEGKKPSSLSERARMALAQKFKKK